MQDAQHLLIAIPSYAKGAAATADIWADLVDHLAACGYRTDVFCNNNNSDPLNRRAPVTERHGLIAIHRWNSPWLLSGRRNHLYYLIGLFIYALTQGHRYDVVVTTNEPYGASFLVALICLLYPRINHICWIQDVAHVRTARANMPTVKRLAFDLISMASVWSYRNATSVVAMGGCMRHLLVRQGVRPEHIISIPPWPPFDPLPHAFMTTASPGPLPDSPLRILYSGHLGRWHEVSALVQLLEDSRSLPVQYTFAAVGEGMEAIRAFASSSSPSRVVVQERVPLQDLRRHLEAAHIHLATLAIDMEGTCVPSKVYAAMCVGRPVLFIGPPNCQAALDIMASRGGFVFPSGDRQGLLRTIRFLAETPQQCYALGANALSWYHKHRSRSVALQQWSTLVDSLISPGRIRKTRTSYS